MKPRIKIALLTTDNREAFRNYERETPSFGTAPEALLQGFTSIPELEVHVISCAQKPMKSPARLAENIFFHSLHVPKIGWLRTLYQGCIRAVRRKLREVRPDLVHGQGTERDCAVSAVFSGYPNVLTVHGNMREVARVMRSAPLSFNWLSARLESITLPRTNGVVCITDYTRKMVGSLAKTTWLVPNAVDATFFDLHLQPVSPPRILCVAHVDVRKSQNALIKAMDALHDRTEFELLFLGRIADQSSYGREFLQLIAGRPWCRHEGMVDREGIKKHVAEASGLVLPSLEDNCPMVILEAMAAGLAVAASRRGGVPELIRDGETGWLFDPQDEDGIRRAVSSLLATSESVRQLARAEAFARFHPRRIAEQHVEIYREILLSSAIA